MPDYTDPRKVGIAGLRGINRMTPATSEEENTVLKNMSRHSASSLSAEYMPNPQKPVGLEMGNLGYGTSKYDINNYNASTFREDANETRAQNQGIFATLGNGLMRGVGTFGTSLVDTTAGFLTGLGYAVHDWVNGAGFMEGLGEIGRNPVSQGMSEFNDKMNSWFPTYHTEEEQKSDWLANIFTHPVNFFSGQMDNMGFMIAGALTGKIGVNLAMKALDGISSLGKMGWLASARNVRTAFNDINTIAAEKGTSVNNVLKAAKVAESGDTSLLSKLLGGQTDFSGNFLADLHQKAVMARNLNLTMQSVGSIGSAIGEGAFVAATDSRDKHNMGIAQIQDALPKIELQERQKLFESNPGLFTTAMDRETGQMQVIPTEAGQRVLNQRMTQVRNSMMSRLEDDTKKMAGLDFLSNLFILTGSSWATFGKYFTSGFRTARGAATKGITKDLADGAEKDISQTLKDYAAGHPLNEGVRPLSSDLKKRVTGNALEGTLQYHKRSAFEKAANALIAPVAEGNEELLQQAATFGSGYTYDDTPDDLYHARHSAKYGDALASLWKGAVDTYSDYDQWQQFAAAFISTAMGIPVLKGKRIGFAGGIYGNIKDQNAEDARNAEQVELGNIAGKRMKDRFQQYVAGQLFDDGKAKALKEGDEKKYRDYDDSSMISDAISIAKTGRINEVMEMMKPFAEMSPDDTEALQRFYDATSQAQTKQDGTIDDTLPKINSFFPKNFDMNDASQRKQMTDEINKRASKIIDTVNKAEQISSDLLQRTGDVYTDDDLDFLTWSSMKAERWNDRIQQTYDKVQNYLKDSKVKLGGTYIGSDNMEHPMTDILHMDKQEFANELYASMVAMDIRSKIAESPRDNTEDETVVGEEKQKVEKPHLPESNLAERLTSKDVIGNVDKLTDKAGEFIQDMKDVVSMALNRSSFIRMYNNYMTNPESLRARNEAVREKELGRLENIHASKLYEELSKADNIDQFREIINTSDNAVSDKVISQTLETLASSELPGREIAGTMLKEFNNQQKKKDYFQWVRDRIDRKKTRESDDTATEETKKPKTEEAGKTKKKPLSEETANSGEPVKKQPEVTMTFVTDEEMAERIEHEMNAANKTSAATDKEKVSPGKTDKTDKPEASEPTEGTELPADNPSEEQSAETTESSQADTDEGITTFSSSEHSDNVTNSNIPPVSVPEQKSTEEVKVDSERQKKEDVFSGKDTSVWKPSMSEFAISDMNNDRYIPLDVTNPAYKYIFKFLRENTDAFNLEGNLKKTDKIIFRITPAYKNPDGYNDTEHHHDVKDKKSYTVFMVNKRTGRIVGVCDSYELASKMNRKSMTDFLSDLFDAYNKYLDSPEFDKNKDWDYKDSKGKQISVNIKNLIGGRVKYASQSEDRNVRNRALGSLMENYKKDIPADRKLPLRLGIATSEGMMTNVYEAVPVSNVINFKDMDYWGRVYLLIPGLDSKYRAVHLDRIPFTMSAYNEMKDGNNLYGSLRTALEDFTPKLKGVLDKGVEGLKELSSSKAIFNNVVTDFRNQIGSILYLGSGLQVYINTDKFGNVSVRFKNEEQTEANQKRNYSVNITVGKIQQDGSIAVVNDIAGTILSNLNNFIKSKFGNTNFNIVIAGLDNQKYIQRLINTNFLFAGIQDAEMAAPFFTLNPPASSVKEVADNTRKAVNEAVENKPSNTVKTVNNKEKRRLKLRKADKKDGYTIWNKQKELSWLKHTFPQLTLNERVLLVKGIPNINNVEAYGYFKNGIITLGTMAEEGTLYHEAFHYVFNMLSSDEERRQIYDEAKKLYGDKSNLELEELLAEDFRKYIMTGIYPVENNGNNIFNRIKNFFKSLLIKCHIIKDDRNVLDTYFRNINRGKYANMKEVEGRPSVTRMNKNTEEEETILKNAKRDSKGRLLAPNGKPSNLTERQYAQVRTKAFKDWFGDWEKAFIIPMSFMPKKGWVVGKIIDNPIDAANICDNTQIKVLNSIIKQFGKPNNKGKFYAKPVTIWAKSPINNKQIHHSTVAVRINGKIYLYDMPQSEYIKYNSENNGTVIKEYSPRLIEYTEENLKTLYGTADENIHLNDESILDNDIIELPLTNASKVVDENGEPLVVYHGSRSNDKFYEFREYNEKGTFFTTSENIGKQYSTKVDNLYSVFINSKNPLIIDNKGKDWNKINAKDLVEAAKKMFGISEDEFMSSLGKDKTLTTDGIIAAIVRLSEEENSPYDALILQNVVETTDNEIATDIVTIKANQIKSATDNIGTYDESNDDIRYRKVDNSNEYNQSRERAKWENQPIGTEKVGNNYWRYRGTEEYKSLAEKYMFDSYVADAKMKNSLRTTYAVARAFYDKVRATLPAASVSIVKKSGSDYWKIELRKMKESINKEDKELDNWDEISTFDSLPKDLQDTYIDLGIGPDDYNWLPSGLKKTMSICS